MRNIILAFLLLLQAKSVFSNSKDTTLILNFDQHEVLVFISFPETENYKGCILLLHGYNLPADDWCTKTSFCDKALKEGFVLIYPDFGKTTYEQQFFPETLPKYFNYPTRQWITDSMFTFMQNEVHLLIPGENNFVAGISTGARGACLLALDKPDLFKGVASLSGDFDQTLLPREPIYTGYYGLYDKFFERWKTVDNIYYQAENFSVPLYLAHGKRDKICPVSQTILFYNHISEIKPDLQVELHLDNEGEHNYLFWEKQSEPLIKFFLSLCK